MSGGSVEEVLGLDLRLIAVAWGLIVAAVAGWL
jgi:hypothetical protein